MDYVFTDFGGILLQTRNGGIAVNCGTTLEALSAAYLPDGIAPKGLVITCEHSHRSRNAVAFAEKYHLPVLGNRIALAYMRYFPRIAGSGLFLAPSKVEFCGVTFHFYHLRYDSCDPVYWIAEAEGRRIGFVTDGKLGLENVLRLVNCDEIVFANRLNLPAGASGALARRLRSISNTDSEIKKLFHGFSGKIVCR